MMWLFGQVWLYVLVAFVLGLVAGFLIRGVRNQIGVTDDAQATRDTPSPVRRDTDAEASEPEPAEQPQAPSAEFEPDPAQIQVNDPAGRQADADAQPAPGRFVGGESPAVYREAGQRAAREDQPNSALSILDEDDRTMILRPVEPTEGRAKADDEAADRAESTADNKGRSESTETRGQ